MFFKTIKIVLVFSILFIKCTYADIVKKIQIEGNDRISSSTIKLFTEISLNEN